MFNNNNNGGNDDIWNFNNFDDDLFNYRQLALDEYDYGDAYNDALSDHSDDRSLMVKLRVLFLRGPSGLLLGGSLMYIVHSVLDIVVISMCCCN